MHHFSVNLLVTLSLVTPTISAFGQTRSVNPRTVNVRFEAIKPAESEFPWKRIPWMTDLEKAMETAQKEKRPMFLWGSDDNPLDRC
ncbi:MAG: hypothetical protein ACFCD0_06650 [Gemmataceae bacterium]